MRNEVLYLNGIALTYRDHDGDTGILQATQQTQPQFLIEQLDQVEHAIMLLPARPALRNLGAVNIPADHYLMLGDNRDNSADSRYIGLVSRDLFVSRANHVLVSFNPERYYLPRVTRIWHPLR